MSPRDGAQLNALGYAQEIALQFSQEIALVAGLYTRRNEAACSAFSLEKVASVPYL